METTIIELAGDKSYAIEDYELIDEGDYPPNPCDYDEEDESYWKLEFKGYLEHMIYRYENATRNLKTIENLIIGSIGTESYNDLMDLLYWQNVFLKNDLDELSESLIQ